MKQMVMAVSLGFLVSCGGSPTSPTGTSTAPSSQSVSGADPAQPPAPPTQPPSPAPPAPTPSPAPTPAPAPAPVVLHATVEMSRWFPGAAFTLPSQFDMIIVGETLKIATLDPLPFAYFKSSDDFIVKPQDFEMVVQGSKFTFKGLAGEASGTVTPQK